LNFSEVNLVSFNSP
jgi:hypothetical protein